MIQIVSLKFVCFVQIVCSLVVNLVVQIVCSLDRLVKILVGILRFKLCSLGCAFHICVV